MVRTSGRTVPFWALLGRHRPRSVVGDTGLARTGGRLNGDLERPPREGLIEATHVFTFWLLVQNFILPGGGVSAVARLAK